MIKFIFHALVFVYFFASMYIWSNDVCILKCSQYKTHSTHQDIRSKRLYNIRNLGGEFRFLLDPSQQLDKNDKLYLDFSSNPDRQQHIYLTNFFNVLQNKHTYVPNVRNAIYFIIYKLKKVSNLVELQNTNAAPIYCNSVDFVNI